MFHIFPSTQTIPQSFTSTSLLIVSGVGNSRFHSNLGCCSFQSCGQLLTFHRAQLQRSWYEEADSCGCKLFPTDLFSSHVVSVRSSSRTSKINAHYSNHNLFLESKFVLNFHFLNKSIYVSITILILKIQK